MATTEGAELPHQELIDQPAATAAVDPETVDEMEIDEKTPTNSPSKSSSPVEFDSPPPPPLLAVKHQSRINSDEDEVFKETSRKLFEETPPPDLPPSTAIACAADGAAEEAKETVELQGLNPSEPVE